jgi:predicted Zn finger-like uncharacterized protein
MKTQCPHCKAGFNVPDTYSGKKAKCPKCQQGFVVSPYSGQKAKPPKPEPVPTIPDSEIPDDRPLTAKDYERKIKLHKKQNKQNKKVRRFQFIADFFLFRIMVFPYLIVIFFAIAFLFTLMYPLFDLLSSGSPAADYAPSMPFGTPPSVFAVFEHKWLMAWISLLWLRIVSEWLVLFFSIQQDLRSVAERIKSNDENIQDKRAIA